MGDLSCFLSQNALKADHEKYVASRRFLDGNGKLVEWELCPVGSAEDEVLRRECTKRVPIPGKRGQYTQETDYNQYLGKLAARATVFPNLNDKGLQDSYGVMGADVLLKAMLTAGEYAGYLEKVQQVNGFDMPMDELVDEAKN
ncbi:MAG: phage portal protein [Lachnospiraceae bacterium]|nr:phage portal protein [Lachnospiraceae bacterium]